MVNYVAVDLKAVREECGLDFARHTYGKGQCSCCYGPLDMPERYWAKGKKPKRIPVVENGKRVPGAYSYDADLDGITYVLFKNAWNGSGTVTFSDPVEDYTCVEYRFRDEAQKERTCCALLERLGPEYLIDVPEDDMECVVIYLVDAERDKGHEPKNPLTYEEATKRLAEIREKEAKEKEKEKEAEAAARRDGRKARTPSR